MSAVLTPATVPSQPAAEPFPRKRFTREEYDRLVAMGAFEGMRCELIDGELVDKMGQNPPHAYALQQVGDFLLAAFGRGHVRIQLPVELARDQRDRSLPEPDAAVLQQPNPEYGRRHPRGDELRLIVEISDTTAAGDLTRKAQLYAQAGVPEYFVLDLNRRLLIAHRESDGTQYRDVHLYAEQDSISIRVPHRDEAATIEVRSLLPEAA